MRHRRFRVTKNNLLLLFFLFSFFFVIYAQSDAPPLIERMKAFECKVKTTNRDLMKEAHSLLRPAAQVLSKSSLNEKDLLKETLKVTLCTHKYDEDFEGVEIIEDIALDRPKFFYDILKEFPKVDQKSIKDDLEILESIRVNGNG